MNLVSNHKLNTRSNGFGINEGENSKYKQTLKVIQFGKQGDILKTYKFVGVFPTVLSTINLDWGTQDIEEYTCTWTYDYWESTT